MGRESLRRRAAAVVVTALVGMGAACGEQSLVDPDATITVTGSVRAADGSPLGGRPVRLGSGVSEGEVGLAILTVGVSCVAGGCRGDVMDTTTTAAGDYRFEMTGSDTQGAFGEARSFLLSTSAPPGQHLSGPAISARFLIQTEQLQLPVLQLVDPELAVAAEGPGVAARWRTDVAAGPYTLTFEEAAAIPVWSEVTTAGELAVDARLLEDTSGRAVVSGSRSDAAVGSDVLVEWRSAGVGYAGGAGVPPSRGRPCTVIAADGSTAGEPRCGLTDGDMQSGTVQGSVCAADDPQSCAPASWVRIELDAPVPAEMVVVRGCASSCAVRTVAAGADVPADVGTAAGDSAVVRLDGRLVSAVDVAVDEPTLREVSVWGPVPSRPPLRPPTASEVAPFRDAAGEAGGGSSGDGLPTGLLAAAAVLIAAAAGFGGYLLARRRGSGSAAA